MFSVFSCIEVEDGEFWLISEVDIRCWQDEHLLYAFAIAVPGLVAWGLGIPAVALLFIYRNRKNLKEISMKMKIGFIYLGYKEEYYYWEFAILYRKMLVIFISVFMLTSGYQVQGLSAFIVLMVAAFY